MRRISLIIIAVSLLSGCQATKRAGAPLMISTAEAVSLRPAEAEHIAQDLAGMLEQHFAPGKTTFALRQSPTGVLGPVLEGKLRDAGFGVSVDPTKRVSDAVQIAYLVDRYDQTYVVRVQAGQDYEMSRLYHRKDGNFQAASGISLRNGEDLQ